MATKELKLDEMPVFAAGNGTAKNVWSRLGNDKNINKIKEDAN